MPLDPVRAQLGFERRRPILESQAAFAHDHSPDIELFVDDARQGTVHGEVQIERARHRVVKFEPALDPCKGVIFQHRDRGDAEDPGLHVQIGVDGPEALVEGMSLAGVEADAMLVEHFDDVDRDAFDGDPLLQLSVRIVIVETNGGVLRPNRPDPGEYRRIVGRGRLEKIDQDELGLLDLGRQLQPRRDSSEDS